MTWPRRSHGCGTVTADDSGSHLTICGWVDRYRNLGGIVFLDIRDHTGVIQVRSYMPLSKLALPQGMVHITTH